MADIEITVDGGTQKRLLTAGKYCDRDILVTVTGEPEPPDDGKTRLYITVPANSMPDMPPLRNQVPLYIQQTVDRGITIDWGDGSEPETLPGVGNVSTTHTYHKSGDYIISLNPNDGCYFVLGWDRTSYCVMGETAAANRVYCNMLQKVVIGEIGVSKIGSYAFSYCNSLDSISISKSVTQIKTSAFMYCYSMGKVIIPDGITTIDSTVFGLCASVQSVTIPNSVISIKRRAFDSCVSLSSIVIAASVTSIEDSAFSACYGIKEYRLLSQAPPILTGSSVFSGIAKDCIIYVPRGSLEAYQTATNWSAFADYMQEEPE